ncbi:polar amino acid transport system substrate-binding protein [Azospirillaceae bacterium]
MRYYWRGFSWRRIMKKHLVIVFGMAAVVWGGGSARADVISVRADDWCPYNCVPDSDKPGYAIEAAREIFTKAGHSIDYKQMPWTRALADCRKGSIDAVLGTSTDESPDFIFPVESVGVSDNTVVVKKGSSWRYQGVSSLEALKIGLVQGYVYSGEIGSYLDGKIKGDVSKTNLSLVGGDSAIELNLKKLVAGRIDATIDSKPVLNYKIQSLGFSDKLDFAGTVDVSPIYLAFSPERPKSKEYAEIYAKGLAEMRSSGRLKQILERYSVQDWK